MGPKRGTAVAEIGLIQLRNCLVNLPPSLVTVLVNSNTIVQNVVVELQYRPATTAAKGPNSSGLQRSIYVGWTGMATHRRSSSFAGRTSASKEAESGVVELDATFGRIIGLMEGHKINVLLHLDPPLALTVNIEPLTPADWEIIELHATFLEVNFIAQIRALPNPSFASSTSAQVRPANPLTLHLSPTSTANIIVTSITPPLGPSIPFAKLSPGAEIIIAPNARPRLSRDQRTDSQSNASVGQRSNGARSALGPNRRRNHRDETSNRRIAFFRGLSQQICPGGPEGNDWISDDMGLKIWADQNTLNSKGFMGLDWICVSIVEPVGLQAPLDPQQLQRIRDQESGQAGRHASKVVARLEAWVDAPDAHHVLLSSTLCAVLGAEDMVGNIVRLEVPPGQAARATTANQGVRGLVKSLKIYPFVQVNSRQKEGLRFGGDTKISRESTAERIRTLLGNIEDKGMGVLNGPLTDGMILPKPHMLKKDHTWSGGLLRFDPPISPSESDSSGLRWLLSEARAEFKLDVQQEISNPLELRNTNTSDGDPLPSLVPLLAGIDNVVSKATAHLLHGSSVLLTGGLGSGKTSVAHLLGHSLRRRCFYSVLYFPCRKLMADEMRVATIKETLARIFMNASWGSRMGGHALVVLDDIDRICPAETELEVGGKNGRSRQLSEIVRSIVRQYCGTGSSIVLLVTAQNKEALHNIIIGGHIVREILNLKAPTKDMRRQVLNLLTGQDQTVASLVHEMNGQTDEDESHGWMDRSPLKSRPSSFGGFAAFRPSRDLDLLEIAGQTDGYMPGDLVLLLSRAKSEALTRAAMSRPDPEKDGIQLCNNDFQMALKGFTPAALRNITLHTSSTTFDSIGGLHATRKILLETLQYPTTYAPIFAQCPLRLRSGLLLYGFPGCGKTLLASAVAGECGLNFISVKGPEILNKYIGASEKSVRDLFERAEAARPCVLFFDEFDSIAPKRGHDSTGVTDRVVNQLLTQMDGAEGLSGVYVLAATSRPDLIDPALLRPGRLDKSLICGLPGFDDRLDILRALSKKLKLSATVFAEHGSEQNLAEVASRTDGYSGADLQAVIYNAQLEAIHDVLGEVRGVKSTKHVIKSSSDGLGPAEKDVVQFRFGEKEDQRDIAERASSGIARSTQITERNALLAKLDAIKKARRKESGLRHGIGATATQESSVGQAKDPEVIIEWKHIEASLASTRSSIGADERRKLTGIYREFQVGRNGEMPNGQGGVEIGARSSLM